MTSGRVRRAKTNTLTLLNVAHYFQERAKLALDTKQQVQRQSTSAWVRNEADETARILNRLSAAETANAGWKRPDRHSSGRMDSMGSVPEGPAGETQRQLRKWKIPNFAPHTKKIMPLRT